MVRPVEQLSREGSEKRGGGREAEAEFESAPKEREEVRGPDAGRIECFLFLWFYFLWRTGGEEIGEPY